MSSKNRGLRGLTKAVIAGLALSTMLLATPAMAQPGGSAAKKAADQKINPPTPKRADDPPILWSYFSLLVILGAVGTANLIPSKRGHQD